MNKQELYEDGINEVKKSYAILENILILIIVVLGIWGMYPLDFNGISVVSILYALFVVLMLAFVLRKHLCTTCYYYDKWCHCGWGKLSSAIFSKDSGNQELGGKLAGLTWGILMGLPIIGMIAVIILGKKSLTDELFVLIPFAILIAVNAVLHKKNCENCKMRFICSGSAAKQK